MRRVAVAFLLPVVCGLCLWAQEPAREAARRGEGPAKTEQQGDPWIYWKWANFLILAGALGYLISKYAGSFFENRTAEIQRGILEAGELREEAERRAGQMEERLSLLAADIDRLRHEAQGEMAREGERIRHETAEHVAKIQAHAEHEIRSITRLALKDLKAFSARLAVDLAEQRVRARMSGAAQNSLVDGFVNDLERQRSVDS